MSTIPANIAWPRVRWRIFSILVGFASIVYFQQRAISIAAERIMPELSLTQMQIGWLQFAVVLGYASLQFPGGLLGQRLGSRRTLTGILLLAVAMCVATPLAPFVFQGTALFVALFVTQLVLGIAHAPFMPVCAGTMEAWLPPGRWAFAQGIHTLGCQVGAAIAPPVLVLLTAAFGWQRALLLASVPPLVLIAVWAWYGRDTPREHPSVSRQELAELDGPVVAAVDGNITLERIGRILANRSIVLLTFSYVSMNYVFYLLSSWVFLYLNQERHLSAIDSGLLGGLPPIGAAVGAGLGGVVTDALCRRFGIAWGFRLVPLVALPVSGIALLVATWSHGAALAVGALTLAYLAVEINEAAYWAGTMRIAQADSMAATGVLNTGGNAGGLIGIPIVAWLSGHGHWGTAFVIGFACALAAALAWLWIDPSRPLVESHRA